MTISSSRGFKADAIEEDEHKALLGANGSSDGDSYRNINGDGRECNGDGRECNGDGRECNGGGRECNGEGKRLAVTDPWRQQPAVDEDVRVHVDAVEADEHAALVGEQRRRPEVLAVPADAADGVAVRAAGARIYFGRPFGG